MCGGDPEPSAAFFSPSVLGAILRTVPWVLPSAVPDEGLGLRGEEEVPRGLGRPLGVLLGGPRGASGQRKPEPGRSIKSNCS